MIFDPVTTIAAEIFNAISYSKKLTLFVQLINSMIWFTKFTE